MGFAIVVRHAGVLKAIMDTIKDRIFTVSLTCDETGLKMQSQDSSTWVFLSLRLHQTSLSKCSFDQETKLRMSTETIWKFLGTCTCRDSVEIEYEENMNTVRFRCVGTAKQRVIEFDLRPLDFSDELRWRLPPDQQHMAVAQLPSQQFQKICKGLQGFGHTVRIAADWQAISFIVDGDLGRAAVSLRQRDSEKLEEKVTLEVRSPVTAQFWLQYLLDFARGAPLFGTVELGLTAGAPVRVRYHIQNPENGHMDLFLAPRRHHAQPARA